MRPDALDLLQPIHTWHDQVLEDHVRPARQRCAQAGICIALGDQLEIAECREQATERSLHNRLVIDQQHERRTACRRCGIRHDAMLVPCLKYNTRIA